MGGIAFSVKGVVSFNDRLRTTMRIIIDYISWLSLWSALSYGFSILYFTILGISDVRMMKALRPTNVRHIWVEFIIRDYEIIIFTITVQISAR